MSRIEIVNEQSHLKLDKQKIRRVIRFVLKNEGAPRKRLTLLVADDRKISQLHYRYLHKKSSTDVIAFGAGQHRPKGFLSLQNDYLGDVVVSAQTALREHRTYGVSGREEFMRYVVHGVLHLLGYRDKTPRLFKKMHEKQESYVSHFS